MRKKKKRRSPVRLKEGRMSIGVRRAFAVTWIMIALYCGFSMVEYQAVLNCYVEENAMFSIRTEEPMELEVRILGEKYFLDYSPLNLLAEKGQAYFSLIPAPLRLVRQVSLLAGETYEHRLREQRIREFMENI